MEHEESDRLDGHLGVWRMRKEIANVIANPEPLPRAEASLLLEEALDILTEVGNDTTEEHLGEARTLLFKFRDQYFNVPDAASKAIHQLTRGMGNPALRFTGTTPEEALVTLALDRMKLPA